MSSAYKEIPLKELKESPLNPRQHFDANDMAELAESVKVKGVLQPVLVREASPGHYELVAGARRFRAALAAGLTAIPAMVRALTDQEALEIMVIENSQRKDVHPLEEAHGYRSLMATYKNHGDKAVDVIAGKVGKSAKYVYDRVKLCALIPEAQKLFLADQFTAGHAILLARLSTADQQRVIGSAPHTYGDGGLFCGTRGLNFTPEEVASPPPDDPLATLKAVSVRELQAYIDDHVKFDHRTAEPMLFPETVDAVRDAVQESVKIIQITHDHYVSPDAKGGTERIFGPMSWTRADGKHGTKTCAQSVIGVIVAGAGRGQAFAVCADKHKCAVHYAKEIKARAAREKAPATGGAPKPDAKAEHVQQQQREQDERARREIEQIRWKKALPEILKAVAARVKKTPTKASGLLATIILDHVKPDWGGLNKPGEHVPLGTTAEDLVRHAAFIILANEAMWYSNEFKSRVKALTIDIKKILDAAAPLPKSAPPERGRPHLRDHGATSSARHPSSTRPAPLKAAPKAAPAKKHKKAA